MSRPCITPPPPTEHALDLTPFLVPDQVLFDVLDVHEADDEPVVECVYASRMFCGVRLLAITGGYEPDEPVLSCWSWVRRGIGSRVLQLLTGSAWCVTPGDWRWR